MSNENGNTDPQNGENLNKLLDIKVEELDETALREKLTEIIPKYKETHQSNKQLFERAKTAEGGLKELKAKLAGLENPPVVSKPNVDPKAGTGELDETALDYLDLKGVSEAEDVKIIEDIVKKTGMTVRQALKDDYVQAKLTANKGQREVKDATPSGTKRSGNSGGTDIATAIAKYEQANYDPASLPDNFALRSAVINAITAKTDPNRPAW